MIDLLTATQDAFFGPLSAGVGSLATVVQHVPENAQPPLVMIGNITALNIGGKDDPLEQHTVDIHYIYRGTARRNLYAIMSAGRGALEGQTIEADGAEFERPVWKESSTDIWEDGVTYEGVQTFEVIVQPTDQ